MSPFGGTRVVKPFRTRARIRRKEVKPVEPESEDNGVAVYNSVYSNAVYTTDGVYSQARIALPQLSILNRVDAIVYPEVYPAPGRPVFPRPHRPEPTETPVYPTQIYGTPVYPTYCDDNPSEIGTSFGDIEGWELDPVVCDPRGPYPNVVYPGHTVYPSTCPPYSVYGISFEEASQDDLEIELDELDEAELEFEFVGGRGRAAYFVVSWYETKEDAQNSRNPVSNSLVPTDYRISTEESLTVPGKHKGVIHFMTHDITYVSRLFGRVDIIDPPQIYGEPVAPNPTEPTPEPEDPAEGDYVYPSSPYGVYPNPRPPVFGDIDGTIIEPEDCGDITVVPPIPEVYGTPIDPSECEDDMIVLDPVEGVYIPSAHCEEPEEPSPPDLPIPTIPGIRVPPYRAGHE